MLSLQEYQPSIFPEDKKLMILPSMPICNPSNALIFNNKLLLTACGRQLWKLFWKMIAWRMQPSMHLGETKQKSSKKKNTEEQTDRINLGHNKCKNGNSEKINLLIKKQKKLQLSRQTGSRFNFPGHSITFWNY